MMQRLSLASLLGDLSKVIEWRLRALLGDRFVDAAALKLAINYRPLTRSRRIHFGIVGSVGKTSTKDLLLGILSSKAAAVGNRGSLNGDTDIAYIILRIRPWHRFCVAELGETAPGSLDKQLAVLQPAIGMITTIGDDHLSAFGSREAIAREFAKLVQVIPPHGTIVLNADDPAVLALHKEAQCRVITYGTNTDSNLQASNVTSIWPEPLTFTVSYSGESKKIHTQLHGRQLLTSALAAIGAGLAAGLSLTECAHGISQIPPIEGRMQPVLAPGGVSFIRDDFKAPAWTIHPLIEQLRDARARRKIFVLGTISDCRDTPTAVYKTAQEALAVADIVIFTGRFASAALKAKGPRTGSRLYVFTHINDAANFLQSICQEGDLIVLKATNKKDHMSRIVLAMSGQTVNCWVDDCGRGMFCSQCSHLQSHRGPPGLLTTLPENEPGTEPAGSPPPSAEPDDQFVIGLGNPGPEFAGTPHNLGYEALDALCDSLDGSWAEYADAWIGETALADRRLWLIKLKSPMNLSGGALLRLSSAMGFAADRCILVFDDTDLPLGKVRTKMLGSSGGHRGVASILEAFQTNGFRRVKIGVRATSSDAPAVLQRFDDEAGATIRQSFPVVAKHVRQLAARR